MRLTTGLGLAGLLLIPVLPSGPTPAQHADSLSDQADHVAVWTDQETPYQQGDQVVVSVRPARRGYLTVLRVDTDGRVRVLFPRDPWDDNFVQGTRTLRIEVDPRTRGAFRVDDDPGEGFVFALTSPTPFDYRPILRGDHWDYRALEDGRIEGDPWVALTDLAARLVPQGEYDYDMAPYYVGRHYEYPRFVCYDCHRSARFADWDPYAAPCPRFQLVIHDDPSYYPYHYGGRAVVVARPAHPEPRFVFRERAGSPEAAIETRRREPSSGVRSSRDVGGRGAVPAPDQLAPARTPREELPLEQRSRPAQVEPSPAEPRSTGEPELRRRRPADSTPTQTPQAPPLRRPGRP